MFYLESGCHWQLVREETSSKELSVTLMLERQFPLILPVTSLLLELHKDQTSRSNEGNTIFII
jgi:hypothetical protein